MPVRPEEVDAFVMATDTVDYMITHIDSVLGSPREKEYRHGDHDDYYFRVDCAGVLSKAERDDLRVIYVEAGWPIVQVYECAYDPGKTTVRLFRRTASKYTSTP